MASASSAPGEHLGAAQLHQLGQRADVVVVLVGEKDSAQVVRLHTQLEQHCCDSRGLAGNPGVDEGRAVGGVGNQAEVEDGRLTTPRDRQRQDNQVIVQAPPCSSSPL